MDRQDLEVLRYVLPQVRKERMLMYGIQDLFVSRDQAQQSFAAEGHSFSGDRWGSLELFQGLGFGSVESLDIADNPPPTIVHNLNEPVPASLHDRYDFIYDGGTLEHVFNTPQALENTVHALRVGGVVLHRVPMNNSVNHGFYQFSPGLFFDYYVGGGFADCSLYLADSDGAVLRYGYRDVVPYWELQRHSLLGFMARKTRVSAVAVPTQFMYAPNTLLLTEEIGSAPFYIWGTSGGFFSNYGRWFEQNSRNLNCAGFIDSEPARQGQEIMGYPVFAPSVLQEDARQPAVLIASTWWAQISDQIRDMGLQLRLLR